MPPLSYLKNIFRIPIFKSVLYGEKNESYTKGKRPIDFTGGSPSQHLLNSPNRRRLRLLFRTSDKRLAYSSSLVGDEPSGLVAHTTPGWLGQRQFKQNLKPQRCRVHSAVSYSWFLDRSRVSSKLRQLNFTDGGVFISL